MTFVLLELLRINAAHIYVRFIDMAVAFSLKMIGVRAVAGA